MIDDSPLRITEIRIPPDLHNDLRKDVGMEPVDHCADCHGVLDGGVCIDCGGTEVYE